MQIHELNTKALTDPAWVPFDDGSDTYKADFKQIIDDAVAEAFTSADVSGGVVEYESEDAEPLSDAAWSNFDLLEGGEDLATLFTLVSEMAYNLRWLRQQNTINTANNLGSAVDLNSYAAGTLYTFPKDGYIVVTASASSSAILRIYSASNTLYVYWTVSATSTPVFVRKGMRVDVRSKVGTIDVKFQPLG